MKLYGSLTSPYVRKCRVLIKEKALACEFVQADAGGAGSPVPALNPLGKVPVLARDNGSSLFDSPVIFEYLDSLKSPALLATSGEERWQMLRWQALADGVMDATVARLLETRRPPEQQSAKDIRRQEEKVSRALAFAEEHAGGAYLMQNKFADGIEARAAGQGWPDRGFTAADVCLGVALEYVDFRYAHDWRAQHPKLARWLAAISSRPSFTETVPPGMEKK